MKVVLRTRVDEAAEVQVNGRTRLGCSISCSQTVQNGFLGLDLLWVGDFEFL